MNGSVQALRGLACLMLVVYHVVGAEPARGLQLSEGWLRQLSDLLGLVRMPLFALLAGAVYARRPHASWQSLRNKAARLLLPMLTVGTLFALLQRLTPGTHAQVTDLYLLHVAPVAHFWFLESLFLVFCVVFLLEHLGWLRRPAGLLASTLAACAVYVSHPGFVWFGVAGATYLLPYFLAGYALMRYAGQRITANPVVPMLLLVAGGAAMLTSTPPAPNMDRFTLPVLLAGLCWSSALWLHPPRAAWLARIGNHSYAIFLYHAFFTAAARIGLNLAGVTGTAEQLALGTLAGLALPVLLESVLARWAITRAVLLGQAARRSSHAGPTLGAAA